MLFRRFNPFASNFSTNTRSDSARNTRPPTYTLNSTPTPTYLSNEPTTTSAHNRFAFNVSTNTCSDSAQSTGPPTYTLNAPPAPTYLPKESTSSSHSRRESVSVWRANLPDALSLADSDTVVDPTESSLTDTVSVMDSSAEIASPAGPRYIYYRLYTKDRAIAPVNSVDSDPFLGRIFARLVAPPHTASSLKRCLLSVENIIDNNHASLFIVMSSESPMDDSDRISILVHSGLGYTPNEPVALVVKSSRKAMSPTAFPVADRGRRYPTRYIYYRLYAKDWALPTMNPVYSDDPYLGCISATLVAPPHTAGSLRRCLSSVENYCHTSLFVATSSESPMDDSDRMSILVQPGPGHTANDPVALVSSCRATLLPSRPQINHRGEQGSTPFEPRYLYYQVYKNSVLAKSTQPAYPDDPYVGRINVNLVSPPHTTKSIIRCISKIEELCHGTKSQLFTNISSESPISEGHVSILTIDRPGSTPEDPMAFVMVRESPYPTFTKLMQVTVSWSYGNSEWLDITKGEILRTTQDPQNFGLGRYEAVNDAGKKGCEYKFHLRTQSDFRLFVHRSH